MTLHQKIEEILDSQITRAVAEYGYLDERRVSKVAKALHTSCLEYMRGLVPKETSVNEEMWRGVHKQQVDFARGLEGGRVIGFNICRQALLDAIKKEEERDGS